jgi:hypothetical protein
MRLLAHRLQEAPPVPLDSMKSALRRHGDVVRSDELQWQAVDQGGAIAHKAAAPLAEDGYAEASCKSLTTGKVLRSAAVSDPAEPAALPSGPSGVEPGGDR